MKKKFLQLSDVNAYKTAFGLSNVVWKIVIRWGIFEKKTIGDQFVRSVDSISANIAEGFGRYTKKDKIKFYRYSFGSTKEALDWNQKAKIRKLISEEEYTAIFDILNKLPREINHLIKFTEDRLEK